MIFDKTINDIYLPQFSAFLELRYAENLISTLLNNKTTLVAAMNDPR